MKSIKLRLITMFTLVILILTTALGFIIIQNVSTNLIDDAHTDLEIIAESEAKYIASRKDAELRYIDALSQNEILTNETIPIEQKIAFCEAETKRTGYELFAFADKSGKATILNSSRETNDVSDRPFFQEAIKGTPSASDLMFSKLDNKPVIVFAAPVVINGEKIGVLYGRRDGLTLSDISSQVKYKKTGYAYIVNNQGVTIGHKNTDLVLQQDNAIENMKTNDSLRELGELTKKMITRATGSGDYTYGGVNKIVGYAPIENTPWVIGVTIEESEILEGVTNISHLLLIFCIITVILGALITYFVSNKIANPIKKVTKAAQQIADGNFDVELSVKSKDEVGQLADAFNLTIQQLMNYQGYIDELSDALLSVSNGDLTTELHREYSGQFKKVKDNMQAMLTNLNSTLLSIDQSAEQVDSGSDQVANGAQALSQGATEQASAIEELSASITEVTEQIRQTAENAKIARDKSNFAGNELHLSVEQMKHMISAMQQINLKSNEISKIIKIIDDIAFQTNILALNAAVEAARAGAAGKGFAVVADEVRSLAAKSAEAAKNTTVLIEETINAVENGTKIVDTTAISLDKSAKDALEAIDLIDKISLASQEQASAVVQINQGIEQISSVVQTNAATAEESAAASEELSSQSNMLKDLISKFKLKENDYLLNPSQNNAGEERSTYDMSTVNIVEGKY